MGDYNKLRGCFEVPTSSGSLYLSAQVTNQCKAAYEDWLEGRARRRPFELKRQKELDEDEFKQSLRAVQEACAAGTFSWGGDAWLTSLYQVPGMVALASILARDEDSGARELNGRLLMPTDVLSEYMKEADDSTMVGEAIKTILQTTPNFLTPPIRGMQV